MKQRIINDVPNRLHWTWAESKRTGEPTQQRTPWAKHYEILRKHVREGTKMVHAPWLRASSFKTWWDSIGKPKCGEPTMFYLVHNCPEINPMTCGILPRRLVLALRFTMGRRTQTSLPRGVDYDAQVATNETGKRKRYRVRLNMYNLRNTTVMGYRTTAVEAAEYYIKCKLGYLEELIEEFRDEDPNFDQYSYLLPQALCNIKSQLEDDLEHWKKNNLDENGDFHYEPQTRQNNQKNAGALA